MSQASHRTAAGAAETSSARHSRNPQITKRQPDSFCHISKCQSKHHPQLGTGHPAPSRRRFKAACNRQKKPASIADGIVENEAGVPHGTDAFIHEMVRHPPNGKNIE
jgi:hypothetical protein